MKIVVLDGYAANPGDVSWEGMKALGHLIIYERTRAHETAERMKDTDAVLTNKVVIGKELMEQMPRLKYIGVLATGYNIVDIEAANSLGITVTNIPAYSTDSVAQLTMAHLLNVANRVDHYATQNRQGQWARSKDFTYWDTPLMELSGKAMGIVGLGNIGSKVAATAQLMGMDVFAVTSKDSSKLPQGIQKTTFDGLLAVSDVLTLHCPLTPQTHHIINSGSIAKMKQGAIIINTGRGPLVDEQAVATALKEGKLGAYCADVLAEEPPSADNALLCCENAFITPHIGWATHEARQRLMDIATDNLRAFLEGKPVNRILIHNS